MPMLFLKTGWMARYQGFNGDAIDSSMTFVRAHNYGHERLNFKPRRGKCYGYAPVDGIDIQKHFGAPADAEHIDGIDVVWASNRPKRLGGGLVVVGWYRNARVYRRPRPAPSLIIAEARAEDCTLLPVTERHYDKLPLNGPGSFRSARAWYAERYPNVIRDVRAMMAGTYRMARGRAKLAWKADPDVERKAEVEKAAIKHVTERYTKLGFDIVSVESDDVGWDLTATRHKMTLRLEVKGTSHGQIMPMLTPKEYRAARKHRQSYRICIVTDALDEPALTSLQYAEEIDAWIDDDWGQWQLVEMTAAQARPCDK